MTTLKQCPCGEVPDSLHVECPSRAKWGTVSGACCSEWAIEFRNQYETDPDKILKLATKAWNAAPRGAHD